MTNKIPIPGRVVVTGGSGALGQQVVRSLATCGHEVLSIDRRPHPEGHRPGRTLDLLDAGSLYESFKGAWAVVHLAAHIAPNIATDCVTFNDNVQMTYNVFKAASDMGLERVVFASSTAVYGYLYGLSGQAPDYLPVDEQHPLRAEDPYGLSKIVGERIAESFAQGGHMAVTSLRLPGINYDPRHERIFRLMADPGFRAPGFWAYVDVRDAAEAVRLALQSGHTGHRVYNIACPNSNMRESTPQLAARFFPRLDLRTRTESNWSGISSELAARDLGFRATHGWETAAA